METQVPRDAAAQTLTVDEVAALLRVDRKTVYEAIRRRQIPGVVRVGRTIRVGRVAFEKWLVG